MSTPGVAPQTGHGAAERAAASRAAQGLPEHVDDPSAVARAVVLVRGGAPAGSGVAA